MTRAKDISKIVTDADLSGTLDVTGTVTAGGLTVDGDAILNDASPSITMNESDTTDLNTRLSSNAGTLSLQTVNDAYSTFKTRFRIDHSTGDISFYEDTGTTPKLFWDASTERLGIGTTTPTNPITVVNSGNAYVDLVAGNTSYSAIRFADTDDNVTGGIYSIMLTILYHYLDTIINNV